MWFQTRVIFFILYEKQHCEHSSEILNNEVYDEQATKRKKGKIKRVIMKR